MVLCCQKVMLFCKKRRTIRLEVPSESKRRSEILPSYIEDETGEEEFEVVGDAYPKTKE